MKKSLFIRTALLGSASALAASAVVLPSTSFAANDNAETDTSTPRASAHHAQAPRPPRGPMGVVGSVSNISIDADGNGSLSLTVVAPPKDNHTRNSNAQQHPRNKGMRHHGMPEQGQGQQHDRPTLPKPGDTITITVTSDTKYMVEGKEVSATDLQDGTVVRVLGGGKDSDDKTAKLITTNLRPPMRGFVGTVSSIDTNGNVMTITFPATEKLPEATVTVDYSDDTKFMQKDGETTESAVTVGAHVRFDGNMSDDNGTKNVTDVHVIGLKE